MSDLVVPVLLFLLVPLIFIVQIGRELVATLKQFHDDYKRVNNLN